MKRLYPPSGLPAPRSLATGQAGRKAAHPADWRCAPNPPYRRYRRWDALAVRTIRGEVAAPTCRPNAAGMTLVELVVVIVVMGIIFALGAVMIGRAFHSFALARDATNLGAPGRVALERIERELRAIRSPTAADMPTRAVSDIQFVDTEGNTVRFYYDAGARRILRSDGVTAWPLADNVTAFVLEYLGRGGTVLGIPPDATQVYYITVQMDVTQGGYSQAYRVTLAPRRFE